ncbi:HEXXH motif-containing putative peptide modification protein [uncultured Shimia sp.]|uniref:aKG-HExxH-type peptide beta-hydroxylase n=1 Tax=uncultured Shimia sp. TaxID=573152 RepID=UPI00262EECAC|nr:HEXXH motif-containing putative peptide modification protein [uncultured Shimia sp.]
MHIELASSLGHLSNASKDSFPEISRRLVEVADAIRMGRRVRPQVFRAYFLLVQALVAEDQHHAETLLQKIEAAPDRSASLKLTYFGASEADSLSLDLIDDGLRLAPITATEAADFQMLLDEGLDLLRQNLSELYGELRSIVHEVLLARAPSGDKMQFDGASHYQFWGLLMLNPKHHKTPLAIVEVLAHEASHSLLFGMTIEEPLVLNPDEELFTSPLRLDSRPMDGIYHATYVSARMAWAMEMLASSGCLSDDDHERAMAMAAVDRSNYAKGLGVIDQHGDLSATGKTILDDARAWIGH